MHQSNCFTVPKKQCRSNCNALQLTLLMAVCMKTVAFMDVEDVIGFVQQGGNHILRLTSRL